MLEKWRSAKDALCNTSRGASSHNWCCDPDRFIPLFFIAFSCKIISCWIIETQTCKLASLSGQTSASLMCGGCRASQESEKSQVMLIPRSRNGEQTTVSLERCKKNSNVIERRSIGLRFKWVSIHDNVCRTLPCVFVCVYIYLCMFSYCGCHNS